MTILGTMKILIKNTVQEQIKGNLEVLVMMEMIKHLFKINGAQIVK